MRAGQSAYRSEFRNITERKENVRTAVGYIRVSTDMQATDGLLWMRRLPDRAVLCDVRNQAGADSQRCPSERSQRPRTASSASDLQKGSRCSRRAKVDLIVPFDQALCEVYER